MGSSRINDALQGFEPRDRVRLSQHPFKRLVKRAISACRLEGTIMAAREGLFCPQVTSGHARRRACRRGIVSGTIHVPWIGRDPWSTVFPTLPRELLGVRVQSPRDVDAARTHRIMESSPGGRQEDRTGTGRPHRLRGSGVS